jgi:hypothetical protein
MCYPEGGGLTLLRIIQWHGGLHGVSFRLPIYCLKADVAWRWVEPPTPANTICGAGTACVRDITLRYLVLSTQVRVRGGVDAVIRQIGYSGSWSTIVALIDLYTFRRILCRRSLCSLNNMTMYYGRAVQLSARGQHPTGHLVMCGPWKICVTAVFLVKTTSEFFRKEITEKCFLINAKPWGHREGCETSRLPHFVDNPLTDGREVVSLTRRPPFTTQEDSW